jgi:D-beta-D-heptose 7-phosphate kinase/D-beta-D-heptose 1-phosphate adenosyltransferase
MPSDSPRSAAPSAPLAPSDIERALEASRRSKFVVVGDLMLDVCLSGAVERICPEAPVPVLSVEREDAFLGGAANVANNLAPCAGEVVLMGVVGDDLAGHRLRGLIEQAGLREGVVEEKGRPTTMKTRMVSYNQQLLRCDSETKRPLAPETAAALLARLEKELDGAAIAFAPDYAKGCLPRAFFAEVAALCRRKGARLLTDPKVADIGAYAGTWLLKPNRLESQVAAGFPVKTPDDARRAAILFAERTGAEAILVTLGSQGMGLYEKSTESFFHVPTEAREVFDVTGAGDTTLAFLGVALAAGWDLRRAAALANLAAGVTVSKRGTARVEPFELVAASRVRRGDALDHKAIARSELRPLAEALRRQGKRVVFTNGCFDLFHPGHAELMRRARALGDVLVVGVNSDASVSRVKGAGRPFLGEAGRVAILCALEGVDHVVVYEEETPIPLLEELRPDILAKGANYSADQVVGGEVVQAYGGEVRLVPLSEGHSISELSARIHRAVAAERENGAADEAPAARAGGAGR